ncbi:hypothetical protein J6590_015657 [Homalodisca vitripennis]|nr:hypothetical protein J6590_015657 [Homalodisca vitripennis]
MGDTWLSDMLVLASEKDILQSIPNSEVIDKFGISSENRKKLLLYKGHQGFLDAYAENGIKFWVLTGGNEVTFPFVIQAPLVVNMVAWPQDHRRWLKYYLGPQLQASNHSHIKFAFMDDMRVFAKYWMDRV